MNHPLLKATRELLHLTLRDMASQARLPFSTYRDIESGRIQPTRNQLQRIQEVFGRHRAHDQKRLAKWNAAAGEKGGGE